MKPGERIRLIRASADSLATRSVDDINLTLHQFGFSIWNDEHIDDLGSYCVWAIRDGADEKLQELHEYLQGEDAAPAEQQATDRPWGSQPVSVFVSHKAEDAHYVGKLKQVLKHYGIDAFVAHDDIEPSKKWREVIKAALGSCHALVAVMHEEFHASQWCDQEVGWALGRGIPVVTVRPNDIKRTMDGFLEEHQDIAVDFQRHAHERFVAKRIFEALVQDPRTHNAGMRALAEAFVTSEKYDYTRELWSLIEAETHWDTDALRRFEYAVQTNSQVYEAVANGRPIPELVKDLVSRHEPQEPAGVDDPWASRSVSTSEIPF